MGQVREATKLETPSDKPTLLLLDIPDEGGFYVTEKDELDAATIREFLASWKSGALKSAGELRKPPPPSLTKRRRAALARLARAGGAEGAPTK